MPQPTLSQVHVDAILSNASIMYQQDDMDFAATRVFPLLPVKKKSDLYFEYNKDDFFRDTFKRRAPGTESSGSGYGILQRSYVCEKWSLHHDIDDDTRADEDDPLDADLDATSWLTTQALISQEVQWALAYFTTGVWGQDITTTGGGVIGTANTVKWSDYTNSQPLVDINYWKKLVKLATGKLANVMVMSFDVFCALQNHPVLIDRIKYTSRDVVTEEIMATYFGVDEVIVSSAIYNTAAEGQTASNAFIMASGVLLCYRAPKPGIRTASAGYTFEWTGISGGMGLTTAIKKYRMEHIDSDRIEATLSYVFKVVGAGLGVFSGTII